MRARAPAAERRRRCPTSGPGAPTSPSRGGRLTRAGAAGSRAVGATGGRLVAASETVQTIDRRRYAPVGVMNEDGTALRAFRLRLTSPTGAISAMTCRASPGGIEALAIERHYGVGRLLRFTIP